MPDDRWVLTSSSSIFIFIIYHLLRFLPSFDSLLFPIIPLPFQADSCQRTLDSRGLTELSSAEEVRWEVGGDPCP